MSEPTPKQPDATRPAAKQPARAPAPAAKQPVASPHETNAKKPPASREVIPAKSSPVIARSYRVRELPSPPVVTPPVAKTPQASELINEAEGPGTANPPKEQEPSIELAALDIRARRLWSKFRQHVRMPPRWERWLTDPQRRTSVGVAASAAINVALIVLLAFVFKSPPHGPAAPRLPARTVATTAEALPSLAGQDNRVPEAAVRQMVAGELESVAIESPNSNIEGISNRKSQILDFDSPESTSRAKPQAAAISPMRLANEPAPDRAPSVAPQSFASDVPPGMTAGSTGGADLQQEVDASMKDKLKRRTPSGRNDGVRYGGGTRQSEEAVERALRWLAVHQRPDGSWSFNHLSEACQQYCSNPGSEPSTTAATGMALLPFLGAGYTHKKGDFQDAVQRGLGYLKRRGILISYGNDLRDGSSMYGQALATIALCEACGMTGDADLKEPAQRALDYIAYAQDFKSGGWRYNPGEPGDTTVTGWMLMALKSGQMARLNVKSPEILGARKFLDSVQNKDGSQYGYLTRKPGNGTTAVGLLCRMYTGWQRTNPGLVAGAEQLGKWGPSKDNIYYDYYATQVLFHFAGSEWDGWNRKMRELLIKSQDREGHRDGSWYFECPPASSAGGRLYSTAMAAMILEVYYRFMPLYGEEAVNDKGM